MQKLGAFFQHYQGLRTMRTVTIQKPVVDLKATGAQIRRTSRRLHNWKLLTFALARKGIKSLTIQFLVLMTPEGGKQVCQGFKRSVPWRTCNILRPCMRGKAENLFLQSTTCSCLLTCLTLQSKRLSSSAWLKLKFRAFQARLKSFATRIVTIANCVWVLNFPKEGEVSPCARTLLRAIPSAGATPATPPS